MYIDDMVFEHNGEYIREPSPYFVARCLDGGGDRDFDGIVHDLQHGYKGGPSLTEFVQQYVGEHAKVTQDTVLTAIRTVFAQMYEGGGTCIDGFHTALYPEVRNMFDMFVACHPKFDTKFYSYLPDTYQLDKDDYGNWTMTVTGCEEFIGYSEGEYFVVESKDVIDDISWVKAARNAVRMFKGCLPHETGFGGPADSVVRDDAIVALRRAVENQIITYRAKHRRMHNGKYVDEVDRKVLAPENSHVDHYPISFARLVDMWCAEQKCSLDDIATEATVGEFNGVVMSDDAQLRSWQDFHREHAVLRVVSKARNLTSRHY